ncbi:MAG: bifunctional folylpolyglutamate synthase/dihydrofolate synthase [Epsilonproteobacteria bacterium]|nr:bifunctional folylpolyglutamate synthase/dihydrofolate synthase [Campylobacterota bacterium]
MKVSPTFDSFISDKPLYYKEIDHLRVHRAYAMIEPYIKKPSVIHLVGTNGKGSTGRIMATLLHHAGYRVGHFSSPHILKFNERIWIANEDISDETLEEAHAILYPLLGQDMSEALSYFEYTTLLALVAMQNLEVIVLEAGLGGEFDATNVVAKDLSVITPIGLDHQDFLGDTIKSIATTKLNSVDKKVLVALQPSLEVYDIAEKIAEVKGARLFKVEDFSLIAHEESSEILSITKEQGWSNYLYENTLLAISALKILERSYNVEDLRKIKLFGRFYPLTSNVTIDVGHNLLAAQAITEALKEKYNNQKIILVYNALADKDYEEILAVFAPYVKRVEIVTLETARAVEPKLLYASLEKLKLPYKMFENVEKSENYLVFGSFYLVEAFLKKKNYFKDK